MCWSAACRCTRSEEVFPVACCFFCFFDFWGPVTPCSRRDAFSRFSCEGGIMYKSLSDFDVQAMFQRLRHFSVRSGDPCKPPSRLNGPSSVRPEETASQIFTCKSTSFTRHSYLPRQTPCQPTMPTRIDDRYLWLGFGIFLFFAAQGIRHAITNTVRLTELEPIHSRKDDEEDQQPEDRIEISTLEILARSPNPNIAASAASLIVTRFAALPDAAEIISTDLQSEDEDTRRKARQAISYLQDWDTALSTSLDESRTFAAREALVQAARSVTSRPQTRPSPPHRLPN